MVVDIDYLKTWIPSASIALILSVLIKSISTNNTKVKDDKTKPRRTLALELGNMILRPMFMLLKHKEIFQALDLDKLIKKAMEQTKLSDLGDWDERPFRETIDIDNKDVNYSPVGKFLMHNFFLERIKETLRIQNEFNTNENLREYCKVNPIERPLFVIGLPRTGTTILHTLLALDPAVRAPYLWELENPVPYFPDDPQKDKAKRMDIMERNLRTKAKLFAPDMVAHHNSSTVDRPEECARVMAGDVPMKLNTYLMPYHTDTIFGWNWTHAYKRYSKVLQMWQYHEVKNQPTKARLTRRWVLKSPFHIGNMKSLIEAFPDADIVFTHRDLASHTLSACSLKRSIDDIFLNEIDLHKIGNGHLLQLDTNLRRADDFFISSKSSSLSDNTNHIIHSNFKQFISDPIKMIQSIYNQLGYEFTNEYRIILEKYLEKDKIERAMLKKRDARVAATLETYGVSKNAIDEKFRWYYEKYVDNNDF